MTPLALITELKEKWGEVFYHLRDDEVSISTGVTSFELRIKFRGSFMSETELNYPVTFGWTLIGVSLMRTGKPEAVYGMLMEKKN